MSHQRDVTFARLTSVARGMPDSDLAREVARQRLTSCVTDHPVAPLADCIHVGRAVGLSMSEMQRVTGLARQTLYRQAPPDEHLERTPPRPQVSMEVLLLLAAEGDFSSPAVIARRAHLDAPLVLAVVTDLDAAGLCDVRRDHYSSLEAAPTAATYLALREHFDDLFLRRPDYYSVFVRVPDTHEAVIAKASALILARVEHDVIPPSVAPSTMVGPELAFGVVAPTTRRALVVARDLWRDILSRARVDYFEPLVTNVIPPGSRPVVASDVLDAFLEAVVDAGAPNADVVRSIRSTYTGGPSERELAGRCVTVAALALRRTVDNERDPRPIVDGDSAFAELAPASGVPTTRAGGPVKKAAVAALELATDRLGPLPGGRLGALRAPGHAPRIVDEVRPGHAELIAMASQSGTAVGAAAALKKLDAAMAMRRVITGIAA